MQSLRLPCLKCRTDSEKHHGWGRQYAKGWPLPHCTQSQVSCSEYPGSNSVATEIWEMAKGYVWPTSSWTTLHLCSSTLMSLKLTPLPSLSLKLTPPQHFVHSKQWMGRLKEASRKPEGDSKARHTTCWLISPVLSCVREETWARL